MYNDCPDANCPHYEEDEYLGSEVIHCIHLDDDNKCIKKSRLMAEAEIKEPQMPDEPTDKEILEWLSNDDYQCMAHNDLYDAQWNDRVRKAIRRRIGRKVSRERVREWAKRFYAFNQRRDYFGTPDSTGGIVCITETTEERLIAMLKELGQEVDNA